MTREQAEALVQRLEAAYNTDLRADTRGIYIEKLMELALPVAVRRVERLVETKNFFPKVSELMKPIDGEMHLHTAAGAPWWGETRNKVLGFRSQKLLELDELAYLEYLADPEVRQEMDTQWRVEWLASIGASV